MAIKDITLPTREIKFAGGSFSVRGLSFDDIAVLFTSYQETMTGMFNKFADQEQAGELDVAQGDGLKQVGAALLEEAPILAAAIIARAADEGDQLSKIVKFPFPVQIEALEAIGAMTLATEGGLGKVIETVTRVVGGATRAVAARK